MELVLVHPEIPYNTGSVARLSIALGLRLHLVEPLGFSLEDRYLKRAGLDYWPQVDLVVHSDWPSATRWIEARSELRMEERLRLFTARGGRSLFETRFGEEDVLVFGCESTGLPPALLESSSARRVYVPVRPGVRSLNLASVVCLASYTALVSAGVALPANDGGYEPHPKAAHDVGPREMARRGPDA